VKKAAMFLVFIAWMAIPSIVAAQNQVTECDRLAAHPSDPDKLTEGVATQDVKLDRAIAACQMAVAADPNNARLNYQLGRVLYYKKNSQYRTKFEMRTSHWLDVQ
jgi:hypothetical protein